MASKKSPAKSTNKSHRAFQPVLPCGNKLLQQRWDQTYYDQHRKLIKAAKPMVDSKAPPARPHVTSKLKKQQLEKERHDEIDRDNMNLLRKMRHIMDTEGCVDHRNTYRHHSLNELQRQREVERVAKENKELLKRLEKVQPMYKVSDWVDDWQRKEELTSMITCYPQSEEPVVAMAKKIKDKSSDIISADTTEQEPVVVDGRSSSDHPTASEI